MSKGECELMFETYLRMYDMPKWERNYKPFPDDKREVDFCWPEKRIGVEIQEETAHRHWKKQSEDAAKIRDLQLYLGWMILPFTGTDLRNRAAQCMEQVREAFVRQGVAR